MSGAYGAWHAHVDRLRRVVLQSADVLPDEVSAHLREVAASGDWERIKAVLGEPAALMRHLPAALADFALAVLVPGRARGRRRFPDDDGARGLVEDLEFFPPAEIQGPFLGLLRASEEHGLRLVHGLANDGVRRWRTEAAEHGATPLPLRLELPSGTRELWGDEGVYYWFRTRGTAAHSLASALMALEAWMEEQVAAGRDAEELFDRVLTDSECVAVAGICVSVALKFPQPALRAALPLLRSPGLWMMDSVRWAHDRTPVRIPAALAVPTLPQHAHIEKLRTARDAEPHRGASASDLASYLMVNGDDALRAALDQAAARFTVDLPFRYAEEAAHEAHVAELRDRMESYKAVGTAANYHDAVEDGQPTVTYEPPPELVARNAAVQAAAADGRLAFSLYEWATRVRETGAVADAAQLEAAVAAARRLQRTGDFGASAGFAENPGEAFRVRAIAGTAAAVLLAGFGWARENGHLPWCRGVLVAAARTPLPDELSDGRHTWDEGDPRVCAGQGLGVLAAHGEADADARRALLFLVADTRDRVPAAVMAGLSGGWDADPVLCWNVLALGLALAQVPEKLQPLAYGVAPNPDEAAWRASLVADAERRVAAGEIPPPPRLPSRENGWYFAWNLAAKLLAPLPLERLAAEPPGHARLLQLADDLMAWTVVQNLPREIRGRLVDANPPFQWNQDFAEWAASVARVLPDVEVEQHILRPIRDAFEEAPDLTAGLLKGYVKHHLGVLAEPPSASVRQWKAIAEWVVSSESVRARAGDSSMGYDIAEAVTLPIFVTRNGPVFIDEWPHAPLFADTIDRWVRTIGTNGYAFACLLMLLTGPGWKLAPAPALEWIALCVEGSRPERLLRADDNASRLAGFLQRVWYDHGDAVLDDAEQCARFSSLVDRLVGLGVSLASVLQRRLEDAMRAR